MKSGHIRVGEEKAHVTESRGWAPSVNAMLTGSELKKSKTGHPEGCPAELRSLPYQGAVVLHMAGKDSLLLDRLDPI